MVDLPLQGLIASPGERPQGIAYQPLSMMLLTARILNARPKYKITTASGT